MSRRRLGILELGNFSTRYYLGRIEELTTDVSIDVFKHKMDFSTINAHLPSDFDRLKPLLSGGLSALNHCDVGIIPNITLHETFDRLEPSSTRVSLAHAVHESVRSLSTAKVSHAAILGSAYTSKSPYWSDALESQNISQIKLDCDTVEHADAFRRKVYHGIETPEEIATFQAEVIRLTLRKPLILACTELSLYAPQVPGVLFDCTSIQIETAIARLHT